MLHVSAVLTVLRHYIYDNECLIFSTAETCCVCWQEQWHLLWFTAVWLLIFNMTLHNGMYCANRPATVSVQRFVCPVLHLLQYTLLCLPCSPPVTVYSTLSALFSTCYSILYFVCAVLHLLQYTLLCLPCSPPVTVYSNLSALCSTCYSILYCVCPVLHLLQYTLLCLRCSPPVTVYSTLVSRHCS